MQKPRTFIIIKGIPKALQIERFTQDERGTYCVKFKNSTQTFYYKNSDVVWLKQPTWHDKSLCKVYLYGKEQANVSEILSFDDGEKKHWRITYSYEYVQDYLHGSIEVKTTCLDSAQACNTLEYLKCIAQTNELGKSKESEGILSSQYQQLDFIDENLAISPYLYPENKEIATREAPSLIFPFGCNASQKQATSFAFQKQISIIQGPPGTGKTQTILNIIANIILQGKTVMVVSNNNSATANVAEKLEQYGFSFIVAPLGSRENKEEFIKRQPLIPQEVQGWKIEKKISKQYKNDIEDILSRLSHIHTLQEELAKTKLQLQSIKLEWEHFLSNEYTENCKHTSFVSASQYLKLWMDYQSFAEKYENTKQYGSFKLISWIKWWWMNFKSKSILRLHTRIHRHNITDIIKELQALFYQAKISELQKQIDSINSELASCNAHALNEKLTEKSIKIFKDALSRKYGTMIPIFINQVKDFRTHAQAICNRYPVVLSTTFSARTSVPGFIFDYIIMDEASQVSIETGTLALTCAMNAVIVGDTKQLPNVVTDEDKAKLDSVFEQYNMSESYRCSKYSFLESICMTISDVPQTMLREHYRCHPRIINFCNQKFYGDNLLIMTHDHEETDTLTVIKTAPGHHSRGHYNQREIDVVCQEVLPKIKEGSDIGIITPYNAQVNEFNRQLKTEAATVHKYQGREKDIIIFSVVDNQISPFADDPNLLNVAISRAKQRFVLVVSGNEQERKGNISELIDYIEYNNGSVTNSKIHSIFDFLYSIYTEKRMEMLSSIKRVSDYDSENLTYFLLQKILKEHCEFQCLNVICHYPLRLIINDTSLMTEEEYIYASNYATHIDFLLYSHVSKRPILAIETDGYSYHNSATEQHRRDKLKDNILNKYSIPLLRLSTTGSSEEEKIINTIYNIV